MVPRSWEQCLAAADGNRDLALHAAYRQHAWTMPALANATGSSVSCVSRVIAAVEGRARGET